jgi:raffinose/stachyose/melibiose transport system substrate-binding protein
MRRALSALMALPLAAMVAVPGASAQDASTKPMQEVTIDIVQFSDQTLATWDKVIADFEAANPDVKVKYEARETDAHKDAIRVAVGTSAMPDIYFMWAGLGLGGEYVKLGAAAPLDDIYAAKGWKDRFLGSALTKTQYDGKTYGVPYTNHGMGIYYNKALLEQAGVTAVPTTYDELIAANDKLVAAGIQPFSIGGSTGWHMMRLLDSLLETKCGSATHDALKALTAKWTDEACATEAYTELKRWSDAGYLGKNFMSLTPDDAQLKFFSGDAAMVLEGDWLVNMMVDNGVDLNNVGLVPFPTGTDRLYFFAEMLYPATGSKNQDGAIRFLDYLTSNEVQQANLGQFGSISINKNVDYGVDQRPLDKAWSDIFAKLTQVYEPGDQSLPLSVNTESWRVQDAVLTGDIAPDAAAAEFQKFIDNYQAAQ